MAFRDRLRRLERRTDLDTYRCDCGESFKVPADTWLELIAARWAEGVRESGGDPGPGTDELLANPYVATLEAHTEHGDISDSTGSLVWPPRRWRGARGA